MLGPTLSGRGQEPTIEANNQKGTMMHPRIEAYRAEYQSMAISGMMPHLDYFKGLARVEQECRDRFRANAIKGSSNTLLYKHSATQLEHQQKAIRLRLKAGDGNGPDTFTLYGAVFNNIDRQSDVILPGAIANADDFARDGVILLNHVMGDLPIASPISARQDSKGLLVRARWHSSQAAQDAKNYVRERLKENHSVACSIGYMVNSERYENRDGKTVRILESINIYEISLVNVPANPLALVLSA